MDDARLHRTRAPSGLIVAAISVPLLLFVLVAWVDRDRAWSDAEDRARRTADVLHEHALKVFETFDLVLDRVSDRIEDRDWDQIGGSLPLHRFLKQVAVEHEQADAIWLTDATGRPRATGLSFPAPAVNLADRDYFRAQQQQRDLGTYISEPYVGRVTRTEAMAVSRRRVTADGTFDGTIHITVSTAYFTRYWESAVGDPAYTVALIREDGTVLVREPASSERTGRLSPDGAFLHAIRKAGSGVYTRVSAGDGVERINAYQRIGGYPVYIRVRIDSAAALAGWRLRLLYYGLAAAVAAAVLVVLATMAARQRLQALRSEAVLRESEARYRLLAEHASDVIIRSAFGGERLYVSPSVKSMLGYEPEELVGGAGFSLVHPDDAEGVREVLGSLVPGGPPVTAIHRVRRKDGGYLWAELAARRVTGIDGRAEIVGAMRDVSARREAAERLRVSEALNRSVVESSADCIKVLDLDGNLLFMNGPGLCAMEVDDFDRLRGTSWVALWPEGTRPEVEAALAAARAGGTGRFAALCRTVHGTPKWWDVAVTPVLNADGRPERLVSISRDVSAQKAVERMLRAAKEEAEAASRTKSQFLATMSHELRTPLNAVIGFSEIIKDAVMGPVDARYREYARDIHKSGQHLLGLIGDVLDLSKIEAGRLELHEEPVDLRFVIAACRRLVVEKAREGGVALVVTTPPDLPLLLADELRLKQIVLNLLSNAVKFTRPGGRVTVSVTASAGEGAVIAVADTGIGMRPEDIPAALEPFRQVDDALSRRFEGTGLGLPLAKMLVDLHGGALEIESEPERGTTVRVRLPESRILRHVA